MNMDFKCSKARDEEWSVGSTIEKAEEEQISVCYWIVCAVYTNERETSRGGSSIRVAGLRPTQKF
jgi:hypothetical protein